mmetsp:Transcript_17331/g.28357  ORF Transcript_17331/g.28357 Transcript_17331/m.28357 type:complete len:85 (+) Transcript_17331:1442-1696(+)
MYSSNHSSLSCERSEEGGVDSCEVASKDRIARVDLEGGRQLFNSNLKNMQCENSRVIIFSNVFIQCKQNRHCRWRMASLSTGKK